MRARERNPAAGPIPAAKGNRNAWKHDGRSAEAHATARWLLEIVNLVQEILQRLACDRFANSGVTVSYPLYDAQLAPLLKEVLRPR